MAAMTSGSLGYQLLMRPHNGRHIRRNLETMTMWVSPRKEIIVVERTTQKEENGKGHAIWQECIGTWEVRGQWELRERLRDRWDPGMHHPVPERIYLLSNAMIFWRNLQLPQGQEWNLNFQLPLWSQSLQTPVKK